MVGRIETRVRRKGPDVTSQQVGGEVLAMLQKVDEVAYQRSASVYKAYQGTADFTKWVAGEVATLDRLVKEFGLRQ